MIFPSLREKCKRLSNTQETLKWKQWLMFVCRMIRKMASKRDNLICLHGKFIKVVHPTDGATA